MAAVSSILTFATPTEIIIQNAQDELIILVNILRDVIPDPDIPNTQVSPDWDQFHPRMAAQLRAELAALIVAIDAAPVV